jgi:K+-sensing histidine kinase KdpD
MKIKGVFSPRITLVALILSIAILGIIDYVTSYELGFFMFYFLPIAAGAWRLGPRYAVLLSVLSAVTWGLSQWYSGYMYSHVIYYAWDTIIHLISFLIIGYMLAQVHRLLIEERKISKELQEALSQVKTLSGLLPICAWCKRIRDDKGYWQQIDEYVKTHSDVQFSHGLCKDCAAKIKEDEAHLIAAESGKVADKKEKLKPD